MPIQFVKLTSIIKSDIIKSLERIDVNMTENKRPRFTFRMSPEMFEKVKTSAFKRNISMNAEISRILYLYFKDEINYCLLKLLLTVINRIEVAIRRMCL